MLGWRLGRTLEHWGGDQLSNQAQHYAQQAQQVKVSLQKFWNPTTGYFYDTIEPDDRLNAQIRPNAVLALSLHHCGFLVSRRPAGDGSLSPMVSVVLIQVTQTI